MEKKKLAILLRGQSHNIFYSHKKIKKLYYKNFHEKYNQLITKYSDDYDIEIFAHTFKTSLLDENEFVQYYKPTKYIITNQITNSNVRVQSKNNALRDLILIMRYDWFPSENLDITKLSPNNFNVCGIFTKYNKLFSDDNILITSHSNLIEYFNVLIKFHNVKIGNLHFLIEHLNKDKLFDIFSLQNE